MPRLRWPWTHKGSTDSDDSDLGLANIMQLVTDEILKRQQKIEKGEKSIFFVEKAKISISFVVRKSASGGINLYAVEANGSYSSERIHQVELELNTVPPLLSSLLPYMKTNTVADEIDAVIKESLREIDAETFIRAFRQQAGQ